MHGYISVTSNLLLKTHVFDCRCRVHANRYFRIHRISLHICKKSLLPFASEKFGTRNKARGKIVHYDYSSLQLYFIFSVGTHHLLFKLTKHEMQQISCSRIVQKTLTNFSLTEKFLCLMMRRVHLIVHRYLVSNMSFMKNNRGSVIIMPVTAFKTVPI